MLSNVSSNIFLNSNSVELQPVVSAEWNHNLFNPPYLTVAGDGSTTNQVIGTPTPTPTTGITGSYANAYFNTNSFTLSSGTGSVSYPITINGGGSAYKIITYVMTDSSIPIQISAYGKGSSSQFGSNSVDANSYGWTKVITYVGGASDTDTFSSGSTLTYTINANTYSHDSTNPHVYYTDPEIYQVTYFDFQYEKLWPTDSAFTFFRPGESYITTGNTNFSLPTDFRKINSTTLNGLINGYTTTTYTPISSIVQNPYLSIISNPVPFLKNVMPTDINPYKYFVSDINTSSITGLYPKNLTSNKIVIKFNAIMTIPTVNVVIDGTSIGSFTSDSNGNIILYYDGTSWSTNKWTDMPKFTSTGQLSITPASFKKITVIQTTNSINSQISSISNSNLVTELERMHLVELSPRLEIDLTDFVTDVTINKSLDSKNTYIPISAINSNDATIVLSGIPATYNNSLISLFSSSSDQNATILSNMLRKNIKLYVNWNLKSYAQSSNSTYTTSGTYIPAGIFYSDTWDENDIKSITIQSYDISKYLQTLPVPDYVANLKTVFEIITNLLDFAGFTDYDINSLYKVCNDPASPMDLFYYYCNSKDTTVFDALAELFLAYQIGAYIDEYGIMQFLSLSNILNNPTSLITVNDSNIIEGGYNITNKAKPGKLSLRYTAPKIKQSLALQNATNPDIKNSASFVYTTSNDVVWQQQTLDSVGYNYLYQDMLEKSNKFNLNNNVLLDIFHTFSLNNDGYAAIENEIVSFVYKEYTLSNGTSSVTVSVKNDLELAAEINRFTKKYAATLILSDSTITGAVGDGTSIVYTTSNVHNYKVGQSVSIDGVNPTQYNVIRIITAITSNSFTVKDSATGTYVSGGIATVSSDYNVTVTPTGNITNVERGLFGTVPVDHKRISSLLSKNLSEKVINANYTLSSGTNTYITNANSIDPNIPSIKRITVNASANKKTIVYPTNETDQDYSTYSVKFDMPNQDLASAGLFFNMESTSSTTGVYFVELIRYNTKVGASTPLYNYALVLYNASGIISWADVTGQCFSIVNNFEKILVKGSSDPVTYTTSADQAFNLKVIHYPSDGSDGETAGEVLSAFINNVEITGWQVASTATNFITTGWKVLGKNLKTGQQKKPTLPISVTAGTRFGFVTSITPITITSITYPSASSTNSANLREIYACQKPLKERSVSYWYQDRQFLNGLVQGQRLFSLYKSYMMQTNPSALGINYYDVQYTSPAATTVDVLPIEYHWYYFPGIDTVSQNFYQKQWVDEYSLAYSTVINTGFRAKMAIANNCNHMVYLSKESDQINNFTIHLNLWTHEVIAPSDPDLIEVILDQSNITEVAQVDSNWIQSKTSALKIIDTIKKGLDGFTKDVSLTIFGNPLIQVGDVITLTYTLAGLNQQKYLVHSVSHTFGKGLDTKLVLNRVGTGVAY